MTKHIVQLTLFVFFLLVGLGTHTSSAQSKSGGAEIKTKLHEVDQKFSDLFAKGDAAAMALLYTTNASVLAPNAPLIKGREGIQQLLAGFIALGKVTLTLQTVEFKEIGNKALTLGTYELTISKDGKVLVADKGKNMIIWEKQKDNSWLMEYDIWNSSLPMQSAK